jgi:hypothetical protein
MADAPDGTYATQMADGSDSSTSAADTIDVLLAGTGTSFSEVKSVYMQC